MPKKGLFTELPEPYNKWEVIEIPVDDIMKGAMNNVPLGNKRIVMEADTQLGKELRKRGWDTIEVPYQTTWDTCGSGIHCSTAAIWRES
jgi:N-dimethylarginine dimethylaminohydrolase